MSEINILSIFKTNLISFVDELIGQFPREPDLIILRIFLKDQVPIQDVMSKFIYAINKDDQKTKKDIKDRNDIVFLKNEIFDGISKSKPINFAKFWKSETLDVSDKETIWRWLDSFVVLSEKYTKAKNSNTNI